MWKLNRETTTVDSTVLATARRSVAALKARTDLGFLQLGERDHLWASAEARAREVRRGASTMVVLGMGGSSLGGRAIQNALKDFETAHDLVFIDNVDSARFWAWLKSVKDFSRHHWVIISKSGTTIETLSMAEFIDQYLRSGGHKKLSAQCTVISEDRQSPLTQWAQREGVPCLEIPLDVGGRFSVLSPVGLLPAAFYGCDLGEFRQGVRWAMTQDELVAQLTAQALMSWSRGEVLTLFWAYAEGLRDFGLWTQQLWAESLGKARDRQGRQPRPASTPLSAIGSSDQHSILQQVMEGPRDKFLWFFRIDESESGGPALERGLFAGQELMHGKTMGQLFSAMATGTRDALQEQGVQSLTLQTKALNEESMGALFMILQLVVGSLGEALDINAFDQPGVELGKILARKILST